MYQFYGCFYSHDPGFFTKKMKHQVQENGLRIDRYCSLFLPEISSLNRAKKWIKQGYILLNDQKVETSRFVKMGDSLTINLPVQKSEI